MKIIAYSVLATRIFIGSLPENGVASSLGSQDSAKYLNIENGRPEFLHSWGTGDLILNILG
jgi:hypothetical protein